MLKFFRLPFATTGDKTAVPDPVDSNGNVSYSQGYGFDYQRQKTDPAAKNIDRAQNNQILFDITSAIAELQSQGVPDFITSALNGGTAYSYADKALVRYSGDLYISLAAANTATPTDTTKWALLPLGSRLPAVVGTARNLAGSSAGAVTTAAWTADELIAETALGGTVYRGASLTLAFDGAATGANGMDTGAMPVGGSLYIYAIYNLTTATWATLGTTTGAGAAVYGGANMPTGYTASCLIWSGVTDGLGHISAFVQAARNIQIVPGTVLSGGTATTYTSVSAASVVPANAKSISGSVLLSNNASFYIASAANAVGELYFNGASANAGGSFSGVQLVTAQTFYYKISAYAATISVSGYSI